MQHMLKDIAEGRELGDVTTLRDPDVMAQLQDKVQRARSGRRRPRGLASGRRGSPEGSLRGWSLAWSDHGSLRRAPRAEHEWHVPERYNIAQDVCDKHPRDKPAMVWERFDGARRELSWGPLPVSPLRRRTSFGEHGVDPGERVAVILHPMPETAAIFFGTWKRGAVLLSMSVLYGDDGIAPPAEGLQAAGARDRQGQRRALPRARGGDGRGAVDPRRG